MDTDGFTVAAAKRWASIDGRLRLRLLNNVWCVRCRRGGSIVNYTGRMEQQDLILEGECAKCGGSVARVIEGPDE